MTTLPSTKQDILYHLLKQGEATAMTLAEQLAVSPQAIRRHLKDLDAEGLIGYQATQAGMGRPQHVYHLSSTGRDLLRQLSGEQVGDSYDEFAVDLLDTLAQTVGQDQMGEILKKQWERKALEYRKYLGTGSLQERVANLVKLRKAEGYMAEYYPVTEPLTEGKSDQATSSKFILTEYTCAISQIAESFPSVCGHELEMFATALDDCQVERTHWLVNGEHRCGYLIQPKQSAQINQT